MKFNIVFLILFSILTFFLSESIFANNIKIAVIDIDRILNESPQALAMRDKIANQFRPRQESIALLQDSINNDLKLNHKEHKKLHKRIIKKQKKLKAMEESLRKDLSLVQKESLETINKQVEEVVADFAKDQKITLVINKASSLYTNPDFDISDKILLLMKE